MLKKKNNPRSIDLDLDLDLDIDIGLDLDLDLDLDIGIGFVDPCSTVANFATTKKYERSTINQRV